MNTYEPKCPDHQRSTMEAVEVSARVAGWLCTAPREPREYDQDGNLRVCGNTVGVKCQ
jgi:hypothetical protein